MIFVIYFFEITNHSILKSPNLPYHSILDSPYIPKFYGTINDRNLQYPVIQFINGRTLSNIDELQLSFEEKANIIVEIAAAIKYIQFKGFVYRDLKPDNVMIDENNNIFII